MMPHASALISRRLSEDRPKVVPDEPRTSPSSAGQTDAPEDIVFAVGSLGPGAMQAIRSPFW